MREIGLALGVVESRVSQLHASAVVHLRAALKDLAARGALEQARRDRKGRAYQRREAGREAGMEAGGAAGSQKSIPLAATPVGPIDGLLKKMSRA